jgi:membrane protease YdiL (CAAX protease family)
LSNTPIMTPLTLVVLLEFAFVEELMFRLGIQNYLGAKLINQRYGYAIAVALTAALWSMAHVGSLNPDWVKLAQIFPLGLALGWLYRRQGTESTIMAHALFNFLGGLLLSPLYLQ